MAHLPSEVLLKVAEAVENLVTEDDEPVDNVFSEKQQRLLTEPLYSSWTPRQEDEQSSQARPFWAAANVGVFAALSQPPLVPDVFLSLDVEVPDNMFAQNHRSYFFWEFGKAPEVAIEIVSNRKGGELSKKRTDYARLGITYYVVYDPMRLLGKDVLRAFVLQNGRYQPLEEPYFPQVELGLTLWQGVYENKEATWLRWCDARRNLVLSGDERAEREAERAEREATARQETEARLHAEVAARQQLEAEVARLREEMARLRTQS